MPSLQCERSAILLCGLGLALANALYAQGVGRQGEEFSLTGERVGDQTVPQVAIGPAGGYVVWQDNGIDGKSFGIGARKLNQDLAPVPPTFRVNYILKGPQENPQVALLKGGGAAFVWQGGRIGGQDIYFRALLPSGAWVPRSNDVRINTFISGQQSRPLITALTNGNLAVVWCSLHQDKYLEGVYGRIVTSRGQFPGAPFRVNQFTGGNQRSPAVTTLSNGNFVVVWVSENQGVSTLEAFRHTNRVHVYARVFGQGGFPLGNEFRVNTRSNFCSSPSVAPSGSRGFTIAWAEKADLRDDGWDVYARTFSASDVPSTDAVLVNGITYGDQFTPKIAAVNSDQLVVWNTLGHDGSREGVFGRFLTDGVVNGAEFLVNTHTNSSQIQPAVAGDREDQFLVAWSSFMGLSFMGGSSFDIRGQRYNTGEASLVGSSGGFVTTDRYDVGVLPPSTSLTNVIFTPVSSLSNALRVNLANTSKGKRLSWNTEPGRIYQVQYSTNFSRWENLGEARPAAAASDSTLVGNGDNAGFYRVIRLP